MRKYLPRITDKRLIKALNATGAVLIEGPKWCGKTRTGVEFSMSSLLMQDPDSKAQNLRTADIKPTLLLEGKTPRLIDEWQIAPVLWDAVRFVVDKRERNGQFILTGSVSPTFDYKTMHTGTGRIARLRMRTMSLYESEESNGQISIADLFEGSYDIAAVCELEIEDIAYAIVRGGWPRAVVEKNDDPTEVAKLYHDSVIHYDIQGVDDVVRNPGRMEALLRSISRNISTEAKYSTIVKDLSGEDAEDMETMTYPTLQSYINALKRLFVIEDQEAWSPSLRSSTPLRKTPKRQLTDPSLAAVALGVNQKGLMNDFRTFGFLFESLCIRDLRVYAEANDGKVYHYRDKNGLECDAIIVLRDGRWGAVEIKLGATEFDKAAENLKRLASIVDKEHMKSPSFLMIVSGTKYGYQRNDGVIVAPIGCLKD